MKNKIIVLAAAGTLFGLSACVTTTATVLDTEALPPATTPDKVAVYRSPAEVGKPYRQLAMLESDGDANSTTSAQHIESMRRKAAKLGANAIILEGFAAPGPGVRVAAAIFGVETKQFGHALAISAQ